MAQQTITPFSNAMSVDEINEILNAAIIGGRWIGVGMITRQRTKKGCPMEIFKRSYGVYRCASYQNCVMGSIARNGNDPNNFEAEKAKGMHPADDRNVLYVSDTDPQKFYLNLIANNAVKKQVAYIDENGNELDELQLAVVRPYFYAESTSKKQVEAGVKEIVRVFRPDVRNVQQLVIKGVITLNENNEVVDEIV